MNFLPFVSALMLILAFISLNLQKETLIVKQLNASYRSYMGVARDSQRLFEEEKFERAPTKKPKNLVKAIKTIPQNHQENQPKEKKRPKKKEKAPICMRLNLAALLKKQVNTDSLRFQLLVQYLQHFYGNTLFITKPKDYPARMSKAIIEGIRKNKEKKPNQDTVHLAQVKLNNPKLQSVYYRMLKGSKSNQYPSLIDYVYVDTKAANQKICLACATKELFSLLFNQKLSNEVWKEKKSELEILDINANKLRYYLEKHGNCTSYSKYISLLRYRHNLSKPSSYKVESNDPKTHISMKRELFDAPL